MTHRRVKLGEVVRLNPKVEASELPSGGSVAFIAMADVGESGAILGVQRRAVSEVITGYTSFRNGDVLLAKITPCFENGKAVLVDGLFSELGFGSTEFHVLRSSEQIEARFLFHLVWNPRLRSLAQNRMTGSGGQKRLPAAFLRELEISLPSLDDQNRIANILDKADSVRCKREKSIRLADEFLHATFLEMFGDPVTNPKRWDDTAALASVAEIVSGITKGRKLGSVATREVAYLAVSNVQDRHLNLRVVKSIAATETEIERYRLQENDLLLTEGGDPDKLGRGTLWRGEISECIHQNHVFRVRLTSPRLHPVYLNWLVGSRRGKQYFLAAAKQTTGIASINMRQLKNFPLLIPPLDLQLQFVLIVEGVSKMIERQQAGLRDIEYVTRSLGRKIFFN